MTSEQAAGFVAQTLTATAPLLLPALGELASERAGVVNIGLEGLMIAGALAAVAGSVLTGSPLVGLCAAVAAGMAGAGLFALFGVVLRRDQVIVGTTINFLLLGLTGVLYRAWTQNTGALTAPPLPRILGEGGTALNALTIFALLLVPLSQWLLFRTRLGVVVRATGEVPQAVAGAGVAVIRLRVLVCLVNGALCALGGAALSIGIANTFTESMTSGRGFIALAVVVFGRWKPVGALLAALVFAAADVAQSRIQASGAVSVPYPVFLAVPYVLTLVALAVRGANVKGPAALGEPFAQS